MKTFQQLQEELSDSQQIKLLELRAKKMEIQAKIKRKGEDIQKDDSLYTELDQVQAQIDRIDPPETRM